MIGQPSLIVFWCPLWSCSLLGCHLTCNVVPLQPFLANTELFSYAPIPGNWLWCKNVCLYVLYLTFLLHMLWQVVLELRMFQMPFGYLLAYWHTPFLTSLYLVSYNTTLCVWIRFKVVWGSLKQTSTSLTPGAKNWGT